MANEIKLPELGENVEEGDVVDVKVAAGAEVKEGQALLEVEAEKSTVEVPSPRAGRIGQVLVKKGDKVKTGQTLFLFEPAGRGASSAAEKSAPLPPADSQAIPPAEPVAMPATTAPTTPAEAPAQNQQPPAQTVSATPAPTRPHQHQPAQPGSNKIVPAGPATRRLARELGIDLTQVPGTAPSGRVSLDDVKAFVRGIAASGGMSGARDGWDSRPLPDFSKWGAVDYQLLDAVRRKTAEHVALAWRSIPHVTQHDQADITDLENFRKQQVAEDNGNSPVKLTVTAFALKASAIALKQFPRFNSSLDMANNRLILKHYYHLGLAVDTERGLLVPVLRDVDKKSVHELAKEMGELADRARRQKTTLDEMKGGTFTITNLGGIGGTAFTPIINYPEVAILGLSRSRLQPMCREGGQITPRLMLPLSLSYDHRVIDGADAARFVRRIVEMLENPLVMLLHA
jgi:pyruvate dehydrogenase E2 component (dihydrolipoamide acetyltransferase)